jgi:hypothetical protein
MINFSTNLLLQNFSTWEYRWDFVMKIGMSLLDHGRYI